MPKFQVQTGCKLPENVQTSLIPKTNAIRFGIKTAQEGNVHFLQFVTRQYAWVNRLKNPMNAQPEFVASPGFTSNEAEPVWQVDTGREAVSPYYNDCGASEKEGNWYWIYDEPDLTKLTERVVFCTFLIKDDQIFRKILWSRQNTLTPDEKSTQQVYLIKDFECNHLPMWAVLSLQNFLTERNIPADVYAAILQPDLVERDAGADDFLKSPQNWIAAKAYPMLFLPGYLFEPEIYQDRGQVLQDQIDPKAHRLILLAPPVEIPQNTTAPNEDNTLTMVEEPNDKNAQAGPG